MATTSAQICSNVPMGTVAHFIRSTFFMSFLSSVMPVPLFTICTDQSATHINCIDKISAQNHKEERKALSAIHAMKWMPCTRWIHFILLTINRLVWSIAESHVIACIPHIYGTVQTGTNGLNCNIQQEGTRTGTLSVCVPQKSTKLTFVFDRKCCHHLSRNEPVSHRQPKRKNGAQSA